MLSEWWFCICPGLCVYSPMSPDSTALSKQQEKAQKMLLPFTSNGWCTMPFTTLITSQQHSLYPAQPEERSHHQYLTQAVLNLQGRYHIQITELCQLYDNKTPNSIVNNSKSAPTIKYLFSNESEITEFAACLWWNALGDPGASL